MNQSVLLENQKKRQEKPLWMLVCFAMFVLWQMGFIYFIGPSLTIDGKTPLPIDMNNATTLIAVCYVLSILWMLLLPKTIIWTQRIATGLAIITSVGLFFPFSEEALRLLVYAQIFCCCLMIGFETFVMVNYFSEKSNIRHLTFAYGVAVFLIALLQNEFVKVSFSTFRFIMVASLVLLLVFFLRMPVSKDVHPHYIKKSDGLTSPKKMLFGTYIFVFVCALMAVSGPAISGEVLHGVFITYLVDAVVSFVMYFLYIKCNVHPFRLIPVLVGLGGLGYLLMFAATQVPALSYVACGFIGFGIVSCQMLPLYGAVIMKSYNSKYISPIIIALSLVAVLVQGSMVEIFRTVPTMLYLVYAVIMAVLVFVYMQIEPFFLFTLRNRMTDGEIISTDKAEKNDSTQSDVSGTSIINDIKSPFSVLTNKEKEVTQLICLGHTNADIAKILFISEHTVKTHTKNIYSKTGVHSRFELATLVSNYQHSVDKSKKLRL